MVNARRPPLRRGGARRVLTDADLEVQIAGMGGSKLPAKGAGAGGTAAEGAASDGQACCKGGTSEPKDLKEAWDTPSAATGAIRMNPMHSKLNRRCSENRDLLLLLLMLLRGLSSAAAARQILRTSSHSRPNHRQPNCTRRVTETPLLKRPIVHVHKLRLGDRAEGTMVFSRGRTEHIPQGKLPV